MTSLAVMQEGTGVQPSSENQEPQLLKTLKENDILATDGVCVKAGY